VAHCSVPEGRLRTRGVPQQLPDGAQCGRRNHRESCPFPIAYACTETSSQGFGKTCVLGFILLNMRNHFSDEYF
jgi:hypothetical protein